MPVGIIAESFYNILSQIAQRVSIDLQEKITLSQIVLVSLSNKGGVLQVLSKSKGILELSFILQSKENESNNTIIQIEELKSLLNQKDSITVEDLFNNKKKQ